MEAYVLEALLAKGWRRGGEVFWTLQDARDAGRSQIKRSLARRVRILRAEIALDAVAEEPENKVVGAPSPEPKLNG